MVALYAALAAVSVGVTMATRPSSRLRLQVNAWWRIFPIVSLSLLLYPAGPALLVCAIGILALRDLKLAASPRNMSFCITCLSILCVTVISALTQPQIVVLALPVLIAVQGTIFVYRKDQRYLPLLLFLVLCYGLSFVLHLMQLPQAPSVNLAWIFFLFVVTALNDIGQFTAGTLLGRHRIAPRISPNKTWEGLAGGLLVSIAIAVLLGGYLQLDTVGRLGVYAILLSLGGFAGDLMFSAAKRRFGIKDFSYLIPGHGGILDRVDSLVLTAPLLYLALMFSH